MRWLLFTALVVGLLALDLVVFNRKAHVVRTREALAWSLFWIALALLFNAGVARWYGPQRGLEFLTGYLIEKALSVDNLFVFLIIFSHFSVPLQYQHRVLFWGVLGAVVLRAAFILAGAALLHRFHWILFLFGAFLVFTGVRILWQPQTDRNPERSRVVRLFKKWIPLIPEYSGTRFTVVKGGRRYATLLLLVVVVVEATDVIFAIDSIPAIFAVTKDPFIVYTSNIFAILGLRALFFVISGFVRRLRYLKWGLGMVLIFVGVKMLLSDIYAIPIGFSLAIISALIGLSALASLLVRSPAEGSRRLQAPR